MRGIDMAEKQDNVEEKLEDMAEKPASADKGSECAEEKAGSVKEAQEESPERAEESPERVAEEKLERVAEKPERIAGESPEEKSERVEGSPESPKEKLASKEEKPAAEGAEEAVADKSDHESKGEGKPGLRKKIIGIAELTAAFLLIALSVWLFINTRGTRLLYVSVTTGRISRYYGVPFVMAAMLMMLGLITLKSCRRKDKKGLPETEEKVPKDIKADH